MSELSTDPARVARNAAERARPAEHRGNTASRLRRWSQMRNAAHINADGVVVISKDVYVCVEQPGDAPAGGAA